MAVPSPAASAIPLPVPSPIPPTDAPAVPTREASSVPEATRLASTPIACADDSCLDACLARINQELSALSLEEVGGNYAGADANFNLVTYTVNGDQLSAPDVLWVPSEYKKYQEDTVSQQRVWNYFTSLIPAEQRKWIVKYVVFTDGAYNTLAWVGMVDYNDNSRWELGVDILDSADPIYLTETITHEVGHLITLNSDQITQDENFIFTPYQNAAVCPQFMSTEGCSTPDSYINQFYKKFWVNIYDEWLKIVYNANATSNEELRAAVNTFYSKRPNDFVREYAATNIKEDMAESFLHFVLEPKPRGNGLVERKILFYYNFPELVSMRRQMIQNLCSYAQ